MLAAIRLGERLGVTETGVYTAVENACGRAGLDTRWERALGEAYPYLIKDKKSDGRTIDAVLLKRLGEPVRMKLKPEEMKL